MHTKRMDLSRGGGARKIIEILEGEGKNCEAPWNRKSRGWVVKLDKWGLWIFP